MVGPPPRRSPSLVDHPAADRTVAGIAAQLWADLDGRTRTEHRVGSGRVIWGRPLETVLSEAGRPADVTVTARDSLPAIEWTHRRLAQCDLYFLSNPSPTARRLEAAFRVSGRRTRDLASGHRRHRNPGALARAGRPHPRAAATRSLRLRIRALRAALAGSAALRRDRAGRGGRGPQRCRAAVGIGRPRSRARVIARKLDPAGRRRCAQAARGGAAAARPDGARPVGADISAPRRGGRGPAGGARRASAPGGPRFLERAAGPAGALLLRHRTLPGAIRAAA